MLLLVLLSLALSIALLAAFRRASNLRRIRSRRRQVKGALLEIRLFGDEPPALARAFASLLAANARWVWSLLPGSLTAGAIFGLAYLPLDATFGVEPLQPGEPYVLTVQLTNSSGAVQLQMPHGFVLDSPVVEDPVLHKVSWRFRPNAQAAGQLQLYVDGKQVLRSVDAQPGWRPRFIRQWTWRSSEVRWIEVPYPPASLPWLWWFTAILLLTAVVFRRRVL